MNANGSITKKNNRLLCYYGDDFTGSTDAMEALAVHGINTVLFLSPPSPELLESRFPDAQCFGVAGVSRSMAPGEMERELRPQLELLKSYGAAVVHYKICSTFDSSPQAGSIGKVLEMGRQLFPGHTYVPILAGVPALKRYTVFGNHFAASGKETYRLDRHPTMSRHPITPMHEADLRLHLRQQTDLPVALMELPALDGRLEDVRARLEQRLNGSADAVLFDVLDERRLEMAGQLFWQDAVKGGGNLFVIGSSGVEYALAAHWQAEGMLGPDRVVQWSHPDKVEQLLVVSGSCSPVTESQIRWALSQGYAGIRVPVQEWLDPEKARRSRKMLLDCALQLMNEGKSVILYSAIGPEDPSIGILREALRAHDLDTTDSGRFIGTQLGLLTKDILNATGLRRILIAGGDTSGYVTRQLSIYAMSVMNPIVPGGPLCRCYSEDTRIDGLQLSLKGGQVGGDDYFEQVKQGGDR